MKWIGGIIGGIIVGVVVFYLTEGLRKPTPPVIPQLQPPGVVQPQPHSPPVTTWQQQGSYSGDCRARPAGTVCAGYEDGYVWLVRGAISGWEKRVEGSQRIQVAIASTGRYEHILGTNYVRVVR